MKLSIIGMGHVGSHFKNYIGDRYNTICYDPKTSTIYPKDEINKSDLAVVCVPSPMNKDGSCDISTVEEAVSRINAPLILIKSTIPPGTTDYLKDKFKKRICFSPEYIGESSYNNPIYKTMAETPFMIVGGDEEDVEAVFNILEPISGPYCKYHKCNSVEAELIKYMENSFLAMKVAFVNEFYDIAYLFKDVSWHTVREGWLLDERVGNAFTSVFKFNRGFGGKCLPKDVNAIVAAATNKGYKPKILQTILEYNKQIRKNDVQETTNQHQ